MAKMGHFGKITGFMAFDENHGFRDFCVSVIFYCPYTSDLCSTGSDKHKST